MKKLLFFLLITISFCGFSQNNTTVTVQGLVTDINNKPISDANVSIIESLKGTKTNSKGVFYLSIKLNATALKISHIGYYAKNKILKGKVINDTLNVTIQLTQKINELESFEISTEKIELLYNKNFVPIYDYQFYENDLLLLVKELNTVKLKLTTNNEQVLKELTVPPKTKNIYLDCFGNIHLLSKDSAYQIDINEQSIRIVYRISSNKFNAFLKPCVAEFKNANTYIFMQKDKSNNIAYYYLDEDKNIIFLNIIEDNVTRAYLVRKQVLTREINRLQLYAKGDFNTIRKIRELEQELGFLDLLIKKCLEAPLFVLKDVVYIFDHQNNACFSFDENLQLEKEISTNYYEQRRWAKKLILDKEQGKVYALFEKGGLCYLKKIDLTTGKITDSYKLEKHTFPTNIKIKNNTAYYLYQDRYNHGQMSLFKQGLY